MNNLDDKAIEDCCAAQRKYIKTILAVGNRKTPVEKHNDEKLAIILLIVKTLMIAHFSEDKKCRHTNNNFWSKSKCSSFCRSQLRIE